MSTSLILRPTGQLTETQAGIMAELDAEGDNWGEFHPLRLKFPTGGQVGSFVLSDGDTLRAPVEMIVVVAQKARAYWPSKKTLGKPPLCSAPDGVAGRFDVNATEQIKTALGNQVRHPALLTTDIATASAPWECASCPLAQWESVGDGGRGQACKAMRKLLVIVKGWSMPAVLTLPPTSIKVWDTFASGMRQRGQAYFTRWLAVDVMPATSGDGTTYAVIQMKAGTPLSDGEAAEVISLRHQYGELVRALELTPDDYDTETAPVADSSELPPF